MTFVIITHVPHILHNNQYYGYSPYVREMNIWLKYVTKVIIVAPIINANPNAIHLAYNHSNIEFVACASFDIKNLKSGVKTIFKLPSLCLKIFIAFKKGTHLHLRCPGNMGLLASILQIFFPNKIKTAKYAGNWDPNSKQPLSYKWQQKILNNAFLTRNMKVLVYGEWKGMSKNIKPFFTASYSEVDKIDNIIRNLNSKIYFVFVGTLVIGKRPFYCLEIIKKLLNKGVNVQLDFYGEGNQRAVLENFVSENNLQKNVYFHGNQELQTVKNAYQKSHFIILPSESEGWPKVVAEGMFWGCVPLATAVSCVPYMLDVGKRGLLLTLDIDQDATQICELLSNSEKYNTLSKNGAIWSRKYTLDYFEQEIKLLLQQ